MASVRARLSAMMFLEYFVWGSWAVEMGGYMDQTLHFSGKQIGSIYSSTAIAAMLSPLVMGYVADRWLATEKVLGLLHLAGAGLLAYAATIEQFSLLLPVMIGYALFYMPTLALTNSISFENIKDPEREFPLVRVFGTLGWIVAGWAVGLALRATPEDNLYPYVTAVLRPGNKLLEPNGFLLLAAGSSAILGLFCFALPHTPPKRKAAVETGERKSILNLLREPSFLVFVVASFLICIPLAFYYNLANVFLKQTGAPYPTALQTIGQISEVGFMALMPWFIVRLGVKRLLAIGMAAWVLRYLLFGSLMFPLVLVGLVLHGVCYDFFFVGSQIYVDSKADLSQRASAQSFIAFVTLGLAMFLGANLAGYTMDAYPPQIQVTAIDDKAAQAALPLPDWDIEGKTGLAAALGLERGDAITADRISSDYTDPKTHIRYPRTELVAALRAIDRDGDGQVTHREWRAAQANDWFHIWLWPAVAAGGTLVFFWIGFRDKVATRTGRSGP